jgi:hypothetical protein
MNPKKPRDLLEELSKEGQHNLDLRERIKDDAIGTLADYGVTVTEDQLTPPRDPPPFEKIEKALSLLDRQDRQTPHSQQAWENYALLVVVIGAIPFVAADAR